MKKITLLAVTVCSFVLIGCGGSSSGGDNTGSGTSSSIENGSSSSATANGSAWAPAYQTEPGYCSERGLEGYTSIVGLSMVPCAVTLLEAESICNGLGGRLPTEEEMWDMYYECLDAYGISDGFARCDDPGFPLQPSKEYAYWIAYDPYEGEQAFNWAAGSVNGTGLEGDYALVRCKR